MNPRGLQGYTEDINGGIWEAGNQPKKLRMECYSCPAAAFKYIWKLSERRLSASYWIKKTHPTASKIFLNFSSHLDKPKLGFLSGRLICREALHSGISFSVLYNFVFAGYLCLRSSAVCDWRKGYFWYTEWHHYLLITTWWFCIVFLSFPPSFSKKMRSLIDLH